MPGTAKAMNEISPLSPQTVWLLTQPGRLYFTPEYRGLENVDPKRPHLFVGNHTMLGFIDVPLYFATLYRERGIFLRSLADHIHFAIPGWRDLLTKCGVVRGTRKNCAHLMEAGENLLVFPGGAREVCKRRGEEYQLTWKQRTGFVKMAITHGYGIIPLASVGPDSAFDIVLDADDVMGSPIGKVLDWTGLAKRLLRNGDFIPPLLRGLGWSPMPRPEKFYFSFGAPIETTQYAGHEDDSKTLLELRALVAQAIEEQIRELLEIRAAEPEQSPIRRFLTS